nr:DNA alkylation repair protein [uncultured Merdimonas sp.]
MSKYTQIKARFEENQNPENAVKMAKYMKNLFPFYGIPTPQRKKLYRDFLKEEKKKGAVDWGFLDQCYADEHRECQYLVFDYLASMQKFLTYDDIPKIWKYIKEKQWWDSIDCLDRIVGEIGLSDSRVDELMLQWSLDEDLWVRRLAIDHQLLRKEKTNRELLGQIIVNNLGSKEFFINKAIGWSLRDYSKTDPEWVKDFIDQYKDRMDKLSIREGSKYL